MNQAVQTRKNYFSTYLVGGAVALICILLNVPGRIEITWDLLAPKDSLQPTFPRFEEQVECIHGWPLTYLRRDAIADASGDVAFWQLGRGRKEFSLLALIIDVAVVGLLLFGAVFAYHRWRRRRRSVLQLHLIDVLCLTVLIALAWAHWAYAYNVLQREQRAMERLVSTYPKSVNWGARAGDRASWLPSRVAWMKRSVKHASVSAFDRIIGFEVGGEELPMLNELTHLQYVQVRGTVTSEQLRTLTELPNLIVLDIVGRPAPVAGDPLRLPPLPHLRGLNFGGSAAFRGEGLAALKKIEVLDLSGTSVDDDTLAELPPLPELRQLYLDGTNVSDVGLQHLRRHRQLERLSLRFLNVNEAGLQRLVACENLRQVFLYRLDPLSAEERRIVDGMPKLENRDLGMPDAAKLRELRKAFPDQQIW